jgi:hypothetical protein
VSARPGREKRRGVRAAYLAGAYAASLVLLAMIGFAGYDLALGRLIDLPLDVIFGGVAAVLARWSWRRAELARASRSTRR